MLERTDPNFDNLIDLNISEFESEQTLKNYLIQLPLVYATLMNEIESDIYKKSEVDGEVDYFPEFKQRYLPVFNAFCSDKKRVYGGQASSYGFPSEFDGIESSVERNVELKNKNRAEVYFRTENNFEAEYLFIVVRKNGTWRIDNAKYRWYRSEKWKSMIL
jgi:hypothetical protein